MPTLPTRRGWRKSGVERCFSDVMAEVGDATSIDRSTAMASVDTNKRQATEAARALIGMAVVERVFHFLDGPADVLCAASACRRWHELATADSADSAALAPPSRRPAPTPRAPPGSAAILGF